MRLTEDVQAVDDSVKHRHRGCREGKVVHSVCRPVPAVVARIVLAGGMTRLVEATVSDGH